MGCLHVRGNSLLHGRDRSRERGNADVLGQLLILDGSVGRFAMPRVWLLIRPAHIQHTSSDLGGFPARPTCVIAWYTFE